MKSLGTSTNKPKSFTPVMKPLKLLPLKFVAYSHSRFCMTCLEANSADFSCAEQYSRRPEVLDLQQPRYLT